MHATTCHGRREEPKATHTATKQELTLTSVLPEISSSFKRFGTSARNRTQETQLKLTQSRQTGRTQKPNNPLFMIKRSNASWGSNAPRNAKLVERSNESKGPTSQEIQRWISRLVRPFDSLCDRFREVGRGQLMRAILGSFSRPSDSPRNGTW